MGIPVIRHPTGNPVPPTFAAYGTCDAGDTITGELTPGPIVGTTAYNGTTDWIIHFFNVPVGTYTLEVSANGVPGPIVPVPVMLVLAPPPSPPPSAKKAQKAQKIRLKQPINLRTPQRVKIGNAKKGKAAKKNSQPARGAKKGGKNPMAKRKK